MRWLQIDGFWGLMLLSRRHEPLLTTPDAETINEVIVPDLESYSSEVRLRGHLLVSFADYAFSLWRLSCWNVVVCADDRCWSCRCRAFLSPPSFLTSSFSRVLISPSCLLSLCLILLAVTLQSLTVLHLSASDPAPPFLTLTCRTFSVPPRQLVPLQTAMCRTGSHRSPLPL